MRYHGTPIPRPWLKGRYKFWLLAFSRHVCAALASLAIGKRFFVEVFVEIRFCHFWTLGDDHGSEMVHRLTHTLCFAVFACLRRHYFLLVQGRWIVLPFFFHYLPRFAAAIFGVDNRGFGDLFVSLFELSNLLLNKLGILTLQLLDLYLHILQFHRWPFFMKTSEFLLNCHQNIRFHIFVYFWLSLLGK